MNQREEKIALYIANAAELGLGLSDDLITKVTTELGPSIYNADSETVACTQGSELETIKVNFLVKKKLGIYASDEVLYAAISSACEKMGNSNRNKYRALVYALLVKEFNKEYMYA